MKDDRKWVTQRLLRSVACSTPAHRMLFIICSFNPPDEKGEEAPYIEKCPVVLLESRLVEKWWGKSSTDIEGINSYRTPADLTARGYRFQSKDAEHHAIIHDPEYGLISHHDLIELMGEHCETKIVVTTWPESEDDARLAPLVKDLLAHLRKKIYRSRELEGKRECEEACRGQD